MALTQVTSVGLKDGEIVNADLHSAASIALSKLASTGALGSAVTATTQSASDDSTKIATTAFVQAAVTSLIDGAPGSLNTLNELAAAINDDSSYATTLTTALATKAVLSGSTNNTICTVTSANNIQGEANLTFDGSSLVVGSTTHYQLILKDTNHTGNAAETALAFKASDDSDLGLVGYNSWQHGDLSLQNSTSGKDVLIKTHNGSAIGERLRINSSGQVWIGSTAQYGPNAYNLADKGVAITAAGENALKVLDSTSYASDVGGAILMGGNYRSSGDTQPFVELKSFKENGTDTNYAYGFRIGTTPNGGSITERMRIASEGGIIFTRGGITATPSLEIYGSGNTSNSVDAFRFHNWGNSDGDYWDIGVNHGLDGSGNNDKPSDSKKGAGIRLNGKNGKVTLITSGASSTEYEGLTQDEGGRITKPHQPRFCIIGGSNMYNNTESNVWNGNDWAPQSGVNSGNAVHVDVGSHYTVSTGRWTAPIAGTYYFFFRGTTGSNHSHFVYIAKNDSGVGGDLGLEYSAGHDHMNVGGGILTTCSAGDYFTFKRRGSGYRFYSLVWGGWLIA